MRVVFVSMIKSDFSVIHLFCHWKSPSTLILKLGITLQLTKASGDKSPRDSDLDAAFDLADEDQGGTVGVMSST